MTARVIAVANQKGGVGKTTTTINLGAALAERGQRVLLLDLDPQANTTFGLGVNPAEAAGSGGSMYDVLARETTLQEIVCPTGIEGLDVAPSHIDLAGGEAELMNRISREHILATAIEGVRDRYDVLLLDCQPSLGLLTVNALCAADEVLIPIEAQMYALLGMTQLQNTVRLIQHRANRRLKVTGILVTKYDARTTATREFMERLERFLGSDYRLLQTRIGSTTRVREAEMQQLPIVHYDPRSPVALAYGRLADEVLRGF